MPDSQISIPIAFPECAKCQALYEKWVLEDYKIFNKSAHEEWLKDLKLRTRQYNAVHT